MTQALDSVVTLANHRSMAARKQKPVPAELQTLPTRVKYARERGKMSMAALAKRADMDPSQITRLEDGQSNEGIETATVIRLARALGVPVGWLAADEGEPGPIPLFRDVSDRRRKPNSGKSST